MRKRFHKLLIGTLNAHHKRSTSQFRSLGLSPGQPKILEALKQWDGCMQKELAKACEIEPATITSLLPDMEKNGLIKRDAAVHEVGTRALSVSLTDQGKVMEGKVARILDEVEALSFTGFTEEEKEIFLTLLERIYQNIQ